MAGHAFPSEVEVRLRASRGGEGGRGDKEEQDAGSKGEVSSFESGLGKQVSQRNAKIQSVETKLKQRELTMNQRQEELQRRNNEVEAVKENLSSQLELVEKKKQDLDKLHQKAVEHLEAISGLSAEEAKERLIESLRMRQRRKPLLTSTRSSRRRR